MSHLRPVYLVLSVLLVMRAAEAVPGHSNGPLVNLGYAKYQVSEFDPSAKP